MRNIRRLSIGFLILTFSTAFAQDGETGAALVRQALAVSPDYTMPVLENDGRPVRVFFDFNGDDLTDVAILTVTREPGISNSMVVLSDQRRLYSPSAKTPLFILETYFQNDAAVQTVELGRFPVMTSMDLLLVSRTALYPVAIQVQTRDRNGTATELLLYDGTGMVSRFQTANTATQRSLIRDVDENGTVDIIVMNRFPEAGRGYETFVELYEIQAAGIRRTESFPLVRELNAFLSTAAEAMVNGDWEIIAEGVHGTDGELIAGTFVELEEGDPMTLAASVFDFHESGEEIDSVLFPDFLGNPFPDPVVGMHTRLVFRTACCEGTQRYFAATVRLEANPFTNPRFSFLTGATGQQ
ncbi:MAG: hypothetical protein ACXQTG_00380 [Methanoculleaceae archaeon]